MTLCQQELVAMKVTKEELKMRGGDTEEDVEAVEAGE